MSKGAIIKEGLVYRYFDKYGNELRGGDIIQWPSGKLEMLYDTTYGMLGVDATNPSWIASGRAVACEYGIYPLTYIDVQEIVKVDSKAK